MYERRKLIDDLVSTGVPAVAATETERPRSPFAVILYLIVPLLAIAFLYRARRFRERGARGSASGGGAGRGARRGTGRGARRGTGGSGRRAHGRRRGRRALRHRDDRNGRG